MGDYFELGRKKDVVSPESLKCRRVDSEYRTATDEDNFVEGDRLMTETLFYVWACWFLLYRITIASRCMSFFATEAEHAQLLINSTFA